MKNYNRKMYKFKKIWIYKFTIKTIIKYINNNIPYVKIKYLIHL